MKIKLEGIVIGNPINMDGSSSPSSQSAKDLAKNLQKILLKISLYGMKDCQVKEPLIYPMN